MGLFRRYIDTAFRDASVFSFDMEFRRRTHGDPALREAAREAFERQGRRPIRESYREARSAIGLKPD
jgi:hypothetical protein